MGKLRNTLLAAGTLVMAMTAIPPATAVTQTTATRQMYITFYGWWDNTPPGGVISYPRLHPAAGGTGTFADPITFATYKGELKPGTRVYVPRIGKYFIMEDSCQGCQADWTGKGPDGGPKLYHIDLWLGGQGGNPMAAINCEGALTDANPDGTPKLEPVLVNPPASLTVDTAPIFNTRTGRCYQNAQLPATVGTYRNAANGQCLADPANDATPGARLVTRPCTGASGERFTFQGAFLIKNGLCADFVTRQITLRKCTAGPTQQWSVNPNGTITDIQSGQTCIATSGSRVIDAGCAGQAAQWMFTSTIGVQPDFSVAVDPATARARAGDGRRYDFAVLTAVTAGRPEHLGLYVTGLPAGAYGSFLQTNVRAGQEGLLTITVAAGTRPGRYLAAVTASGSTGTHTAVLTLTVIR